MRCAVIRAVELKPRETSVDNGDKTLMTSASVARKTVRETMSCRVVACKLRGDSERR